MNDSDWTRCVLIPFDDFEAMNIAPFEEVLLSSGSVTIIVQAVPNKNPCFKTSLEKFILHPFVEEFLVSAASKGDEDKLVCEKNNTSLGIQFMLHHAFQGLIVSDVIVSHACFRIEKLNYIFDGSNVVSRQENHLNLSLRFIGSSHPEYDGIFNFDPKEDGSTDTVQEYVLDQIKQEFGSRIVKSKTFIPITLPPLPGVSRSLYKDELAIFYIENIQNSFDGQSGNPDLCFLIDSIELISINVSGWERTTAALGCNAAIINNKKPKENVTCPGYTSLFQDIIDLSQIRVNGGCPTGILLNGCAGVGKTRLVSHF